MSMALWYYCNLIDDMEASDVVPVVQIRRCVVQVDANTTWRPTASLALRAVVDDELVVGRSTYVLTASVAASAEAERTATELIETETVKVEALVPVVSPVKKTATHPVSIEEEVQENVSEVATGRKTVHDTVEVVAVVDVDVIAAKEEKPASIDEVTHEGCAVALEEMDSEAAATSDVLAPAPRGKGLAEDVMLEGIAEPKKRFTRMALTAEDKVNSIGDAEGSDKAAYMVEHVNAALVKKTMEVVQVAEASSTRKVVIPATSDESETEQTQPEVTETLAIEKIEAVAAAKVNEAPESEIDETMVIDPDVVAKEAAAIEAQTSSFRFIPEHIRNNSYAVSSVALAVATAITAALLARR